MYELYKNRNNFLALARNKIKDDFKPELISEAWEYAQKAHEGQKRESNLAYFEHPVSVAKILLDETNCDTETIVAALLHDVVEDTNFNLEEIENIFGKNVSSIVDGLTKVSVPINKVYSKDYKKDKENAKKKSIQKLFIAISKDPRVALIKLADRLHNLRTLGAKESKDKIKLIAEESLLIYGPLAEVLGLGAIQRNLQDNAFKYYDRKMYNSIYNKLNLAKNKSKQLLDRILDDIKTKFDKENVKADIYGRKKEIYSIYRKMLVLDIDLDKFDDLYDIFGIRIIVETEEECYKAEQVILKSKDIIDFNSTNYIANPRKPFNYQAIHMIITHKVWDTIEIQIRSNEMHEHAEKGSSAHWKYKLKDILNIKLERQLENLKLELDDINEQHTYDEVKTIIQKGLSDIIVVWTPKQQALYLPLGATVLDFAYKISSDLGNKCVRAKITERGEIKIVPIDYVLKNGAIVEIESHKNQTPSLSWITQKKAKTNNAISKINSYLGKYKKQLLIDKGELIFSKYFKISSNFEIDKKDIIEDLFVKYKLNDERELFISIQYDNTKFLKRLGCSIINSYLLNKGLSTKMTIDLVGYSFDKNLISSNNIDEFYINICSNLIKKNNIVVNFGKWFLISYIVDNQGLIRFIGSNYP